MRADALPAPVIKLLRRGTLVAGNAAGTLLPPSLSLVISAAVVRGASFELWGAFVQLMVLVQLGAYLAGWGSKEYLVRAFSRSPAAIGATWRSCLLARLPLLAAVCAALMLLPAAYAPWAALWALGLFAAQSHDALVTYHRRFRLSALVELGASGATLALALALGRQLGIGSLLAIFALASVGRAAALALAFRRATLAPGAGAGFDRGYMLRALPFFLVGLSGLLQSRADLYLVSATLPHAEVGRYQALTNLLIYVQAVASLVLGPFLRGIYRLPAARVAQIARHMFGLGLALVAPALAAVTLAMRLLYGVALPPELIALGALLVLPAFGYSPLVYALFREERQLTVAAVTALGLAANVALNLLLIARLGVAGALAASAASQWVIFAAYAALRRAAPGS